MQLLLQINVFGSPEVWLDGRRIESFGTTKAEGLLYYLVVTRRRHSRSVLASLLWGESPENRARRSLTNTLSSLKKVLGEFLQVDPSGVAVNPDQPFEMDLIWFERGDTDASQAISPKPLQQAANQFRGEFLEGFYVRKAPQFDEWLSFERERLRNRAIDLLEALAKLHLRERSFEEGVQAARRLVELDPLRESAHRQLMLLLARSGQRNAAIQQYHHCRNILDKELGIAPMPETQAIFHRLQNAGAPVPNNLPTDRLPFVGRLQELSQVTSLLDQPDCQLVTVLGPGGIGKTRLGLEAARWYVEPDKTLAGASFPDGVYFVPLSSISIPPSDAEHRGDREQLGAILAAEIAAALGFQFHAGQGQLGQLRTHLQNKDLLLVLDNFESLIAAADHLAALLAGAPRLKLLVTSRERLQLREEHALSLEGLAYPQRSSDDARVSEEVVELQKAAGRFDAIALFIQEAGKFQVGMEWQDEDIRNIIEITRLVDGSPLGIILAASWVRSLSCTEIAGEIKRGIDFLSSTMRDLPARQQSLRAVFDQSWEMLSHDERQGFRRLSVFRGGFTRAAAEKVAGTSLHTLTGLVDKSMLFHDPSGRYGIHEALRVFGAEKLATNPETHTQCLDAHISYFANFMAEREARLFLRENLEPLLEIRVELDNIRAYWRRALERNNTLGYQALNMGLWSLACYYTFGNLFQEAIDIFGSTSARLRQHHTSDQLGDPEKLVMENISLALGTFHHWVGDIDTASQRHRETLEALEHLNPSTPGYYTVYGRALGFLGSTLLLQGDYPASENALRQALERMETDDERSFDDRSFYVWTSYLLGMCLYNIGNLAEAERMLERTLRSLRRAGDFLMHAQCLGFFARTRFELGKPWQQIIVQLRDLRAECREMGAPMLIIQANTHLGITLNLAGEERAAEARAALCEGLGIYRSHEVNVPSSLAYLLNALGRSEMALNQPEPAERHIRRALEIAMENRIVPIALESLLHLTQLMKGRADVNWNGSVLLLVSEHPASGYTIQRAAEQRMQELGFSSRTAPSLKEAAAQILALPPPSQSPAPKRDCLSS